MSRSESESNRATISLPVRVAAVATALICLLLFCAHHRLSATLEFEAMPRSSYRDAYLIPQADTLRALSLGHKEMAADLVWLKALSYFALHFVDDQDYEWLERYIDTIVELDPDFCMVYYWAGVVTMYGGQEINNQAVMSSIRFLEQGVSACPEEWQLSFMLGCNYRYELRSDDEEEAADWRRLGAYYLQLAAESPEAPPWLALTAGKVFEHSGEVEESIRVRARTFLGRRGILGGTLASTRSGARHHPAFGDLNPDHRTLISSGIHLRKLLPDVGWWQLLNYRRAQFGQLDGPTGFLSWELRTLLYGDVDPYLESPEWTPIDPIFYPTVEQIRAMAVDRH